MAGEVIGGDMGANDWQQGFTPGSGGLWCDKCRALVRQDPGSTRAHREWDEKIERLVARTLGGG